jgi:aminoglycoside/choline kinase family phosphotransferase
MEPLIKLFQQYCGEVPATTEKLAGAGSNRQYYRLTDSRGRSIIGVQGTSKDENHAFVYLARHFAHRQLPVPKVLAVSDDEMCYLQEDLGSMSLFDALRGGREAGGRYNQKEKQLLVETIRQLPNIQIRGARGLDWNNCYPSRSLMSIRYCSTLTTSSIAS